MQEKMQQLKDMLDVAVEQGVHLYQDEQPASPDDIARRQQVNEDNSYMPSFIVKDSGGDIKEIWY